MHVDGEEYDGGMTPLNGEESEDDGRPPLNGFEPRRLVPAEDEARSQVGSVHSGARSDAQINAQGGDVPYELDAMKTLLSRSGDPASPFPSTVSASKWTRWLPQYNECFKPCRTMVINIPISVWRADAINLADVQTAVAKGQHAQTQAAFALLSMLTAGTARGHYTGTPPIISEMHARGQDSEEITKKIKELGTLQQYSFCAPRLPGESPQMEREVARQFVWALELVVNTQRKPVAVRVYKIVDDPTHSDSQLWTQVMSSNDVDDREGRANKLPSQKRNGSRKAMSSGLRAFVDGDKLEETAEFQHATIRDLHTLSTTYMAYGGRHDSGCHLFSNIHEEITPSDMNDRLTVDSACGGLNKLGPEWALNIRRGKPLTAGMLGSQGESLAPSEELVTISSYLTPAGLLKFPERSIKEGLVYVSSNGFLTNLFEADLPFPVLNAIRVGDSLLKFVFESHYLSHPVLVSALNCALDQEEVAQSAADKTRRALTGELCVEDAEAAVEESVSRAIEVNHRLVQARTEGKLVERVSELTDEEDFYSNQMREPIERVFFCILRGEEEISELVQMVNANRNLKVSSFDKTAEERERLAGTGKTVPGERPREALKVVGAQIDRGLAAIAAWEDRQRAVLRGLIESRSPEAANFELAMNERHSTMVRQMNELGLRMFERMWLSKAEVRDVPPGFVKKREALMSNMQKLRAHLHDTGARYRVDPQAPAGVGTPNVAFGLRKALVGRQTALGAWRTMLMSAVSGVAMIDGREVRVCIELWLQTNEVFYSFSTVLVIPGEAGIGKSMRTERMKILLPDGTFFDGGTRSAQSGANGKWGEDCGFAVSYDEMVAFFAGKDPETQERAKTMLSANIVNHSRTQKRVRSDGTEDFVSEPLVTLHYETHIVNTNLGPCMHQGDDAPTDSKVALIDRTHTQAAFDVNPGAHKCDDAFVREVNSSQNTETLLSLRVLAGLIYLVQMYQSSVKRWKKDLSYANELYGHFDDILKKEFGFSPPQNRVVTKRLQTLATVAVEEAIAEKFGFQDTAHLFPEMRPELLVDMSDPDPAGGCRGHLCTWEDTLLETVIRRVAAPSPHAIITAWSHALDYNQSTSAQHFWVLKQCADAVGLQADLHTLRSFAGGGVPVQTVGRRDSVGQAGAPSNAGGAHHVAMDVDAQADSRQQVLLPVPMPRFLSQPQQAAVGTGALDSGLFVRLMAGGASEKDIRTRLSDMQRQRVCRAALAAHLSQTKPKNGGTNAYESILKAWQSMDKRQLPVFPDRTGATAAITAEQAAGYSFPDPSDLVLVGYEQKHLVEWACGRAVDSSEAKADPCFGQVESASWEFLNVNPAASGKFPGMLDAGWRTLSTHNAIDPGKRWRDNTRLLINAPVPGGDSAVKKFGLSENTTRDVLWQLTKGPTQLIRETRPSHHVAPTSHAMTRVEYASSLREGPYTLGQEDTGDEPAADGPAPPKRFIRPAKAVEIAKMGAEAAAFVGPVQPGSDVTTPSDDPGQIHRRLRAIVAHGSLPAAGPLYSTLVSEQRPVRMLPNNQLAFSTEKLARHERLFVECALANALIPGFVNRADCDPYKYLPSCFRKQVAGSGGGGLARATAGELGGLGDPPSSAANTPSVADVRHETLPVSYDMLSVHLTHTIQQMFYFDTTEYLENMLHGSSGARKGIAEIQKNIPLFTSRFPTLEGDSSSPVAFEWSTAATREAKARDTQQRSEADVKKALRMAQERFGRPLKVTDPEVQQIMHGMSKTTNMKVAGNLFSWNCWWGNTVLSLTQKGLISPRNDPVLSVLEESVLGIHSGLQRDMVKRCPDLANYFVVGASSAAASHSANDVTNIEKLHENHAEGIKKRVASRNCDFEMPRVKHARA